MHLKRIVSTITAMAIMTPFMAVPLEINAVAAYGDVDADGVVSSKDALAVLMHITNMQTLDANAQVYADVNNDGEITSADSLNVLQYVTGVVSEFNAENNGEPEEDLSFYEICSSTIKENDSQYGSAIASDEFHSKRIVAKASEELDLSKYAPSSIASRTDDELNYIYMLQFDTVEKAEICINDLQANSSVLYAEFDEYISDETVNDELEDADIETDSKSWGVAAMEADKYAAYLSNFASNSVLVAVVDTGVSSHSFMKGRILKGRDFVDNDNDANDHNFHGTHVAGTIVDCTPSLNINILPVRALDENGRGSTVNVGNSIRYAAEHNADVINLSLGGGCSKYIDDSIKYAISKGSIVVVAAGNDGNNTSGYCPAHIPECITVAAIDSSYNKADFSNYGSAIDFAAPGVKINSCIPGGSYKELDGTSMATPHISAAVAMMIYSNKYITPAMLETSLALTCQDLGDKGRDDYYGNGIPKLSKLLPSIYISQSSMSLNVGKSAVLSVTTSPANLSVSWSSSDTGIAKVSNGTVTAVAAGKAVITAKISYNGSEYTASCEVTVQKEADDTSISDSTEYYIVPKCATDLCLVVANDSQSNKGNVCIGVPSSKSAVWVAHRSGDYWYFINKNSGKALDIYGDTIASKSNAQIWTLNTNTTQLFKLTKMSDGYYTLSPKGNTGINLDVYGDSSWEPGTNVWTYTVNNNSTQRFTFKKV